MSEWERDQISARTKAALTAAKARGVVLGATARANLKQNLEARTDAANAFAKHLSGALRGFKAAGMTQRQMIGQLNTLGIKTMKGGDWSLAQLQRVLKRIA
jgi:DNA invertase Pin-like site-specific DNA recombinase